MVRDTAVSAAFNQATFYSYDIRDNVDTLLQDYGVPSVYGNVMNQNGNRYKKISYNYDLISGKVNEVAYQRGWSDQFFHRYSYDAENRLILTETSVDDKTWERDARYDYYRHGPLARMVLGDQQVQGVDYAYTLQGWLSGMNSTMGDSANDMGGDGLSGGIHQYTARDVTSLHLSYYTGDYVPINANVSAFPAAMGYQNPNDYRPLYNGNISSMAVNNRGLSNSTGSFLMLYTYRYDQLNRLLGATANNKTIDGTNTWSGLTTLSAYREDLQYDGNGNILGYARNGNKTDPMMDSLNYHYVNGTNRLDWVSDSIAANKYGGAGEIADIDNQSTGNYGYDAIGNLIRDDAEGITNIRWTVYGKIAEIDKTANANQPITRINYSYDAQGNRTGSITEQNDGTKRYTWYVRDAQGNVLATYGAQGPGTELSSLNLSLTERHLYGSSALGMYSQSVNVDNGAAAMTDSNGIQYYRGYRQYALSNHLGNVLSTISDRKSGTDQNGDGQIDYYDADIRTAQDYYAFGMTMPGRNYTAPSASAYRYGFNGKENDNEVKGTGNQQDYGMRIYDPRLGRFLSEDPLTKKYPELTPYQFASNRPIDGIDLDGLEYATFKIYVDKNQKVVRIAPPTKDYLLKNNGTEGPGVKYVVHRVDEGNRPDEVRWSKNIYGIFEGSDNPRLPIVGRDYRELHDDYSLDPIDETDANSKSHDQDFDKKKISGLKGVLDKKSSEANAAYIKRAQQTIKKFENGENDDITKKPITKNAMEAAKFGKKWFQRAEKLKKPVDAEKESKKILTEIRTSKM